VSEQLGAQFLPGVEMEWAECDFCGMPDGRLLFEGGDRLHGLPGRFRFVECQTCGWIRQNPRPTLQSIGVYYPDEYEPYIRAIEDEAGVMRRWGRRYGMWKRCRAVMRHVANGRLLDVGCATGVFLNAMRRQGEWDVYGVEPNVGAAHYARQRFNLSVHIGILEQAESLFSPASFDAVTMWNVLEHLHRPVLDIRRIHRLLKEDGLFVFTIPNIESLEARWFGPSWIGWDLPRHLYLFPQTRLSDQLSSLGFTLVARQCLSGSYGAFVMSLKQLLNERPTASAHWPTALLGTLRSWPAQVLAAPFFWLVNLANRATVITLFARKNRT